jgi:site-specific DNA recombinase
MTALRAAIYRRVSDDRSGRARSPEEQEADCRRDCDRAGWTVVEVVTDNDRGASRYSRGEREGFEHLKQLVGSGRVDIVVVWEASRLQRDMAVYVALRDLCRANAVLWSYNGRLFDLDDADDAFTTGMDALLSEREVAFTSKRVLRAIAANAAAGRPHGRPLLGYRRIYDARTRQMIGQEPDPQWAPVIREMFAQVAGGRPCRQVAAWLNENGHVLSTTGGPWTGPRVSGQIRGRLGYLGHREHRGLVTVRNAWPALVDEVTFNRVQTLMADPARRSGPTGLGLGLLVGMMTCGLCGGRIDLTMIGRAGKMRRVYRCGASYHLARSLDRLDPVVSDLLVERLGRPDLLDAFTFRADAAPLLRLELEAVCVQLDETERAIKARTMPAGMGARIATDLEGQVADIEARLAQAVEGVPSVLLKVVGVDARRRWDALPAAERRTVAGVLLCDVVLHPVGKGVVAIFGLSFRWVGSDQVHHI